MQQLSNTMHQTDAYTAKQKNPLQIKTTEKQYILMTRLSIKASNFQCRCYCHSSHVTIPY
jgi:hypothetical protein